MLVINYRPVSVLPFFLEILEKIMYNRILAFINKHNLLYKFQFGFRRKHGTDIALIVLVDKIMSAFNDGEMALGVFFDLSKAFDAVVHDILLNKLDTYGIRGTAHDWFRSYLFQRKQFVAFNISTSNESTIECGVPQGSILGPLFFLLHINDMVNTSAVLFSLLFADDTNVFVTGKNLSNLVESMNTELKKLIEWMHVNELSLNIKKTKYMLFTLRKKPRTSDDIFIDHEPIEKVEHFKFLCVIIDSKLSWVDHIQLIKKKISKGVGMLC